MKSPKDTTTTIPGDEGKCRDADKDKRNRKEGKGNNDARSLVNMLANKTWAGNFAIKQNQPAPPRE